MAAFGTPIAIVGDANIHCLQCAVAAYGRLITQAMFAGNRSCIDSEGNPLGVVLSGSEDARLVPDCTLCGYSLEDTADEWAARTISAQGGPMIDHLPIAIQGDEQVFCLEQDCALSRYPTEVRNLLWSQPDQETPRDEAGRPLTLIYSDEALDHLTCQSCDGDIAHANLRRVAEALETARQQAFMARAATAAVREWIDALKERRIEARRRCRSTDRWSGVTALHSWLSRELSDSDLTHRALEMADMSQLYQYYHVQYHQLLGRVRALGRSK